MIILLIISFILIICSLAFIDAEHVVDKDYIEDHTSRVFSRAAICICFALFDTYAAIVFALMFWALFDAAYNTFAGQKLFYTGQVAKTDKFFSNKKWLYVSSKIICLIIAILLTFKIKI